MSTSLMNRWSTIQKSVSKFTACLSEIEHLNQSGTTEHDKIQKAKAVYRSQNNDVPFPYEHCWILLKDEQKWLYHGKKDKQRRRSSMATSVNVTHTADSINEGEGDNVSNGNNVEFERPIGRKAEKSKKKEERGSFRRCSEFHEKRTEILEDARNQGLEFLRLEKEKMEMRRKKLQSEELDREERIMMIDTSRMTEAQRKYWKGRQDEIIGSQPSRD
ncbi:hypothetical protein SLA2020_285130 [Shorea laevis]